jgi:hypothetical protein
MITRAFLVLLALLTGLSTANAAGETRGCSARNALQVVLVDDVAREGTPVTAEDKVPSAGSISEPLALLTSAGLFLASRVDHADCLIE